MRYGNNDACIRIGCSLTFSFSLFVIHTQGPCTASESELPCAGPSLPSESSRSGRDRRVAPGRPRAALHIDGTFGHTMTRAGLTSVLLGCVLSAKSMAPVFSSEVSGLRVQGMSTTCLRGSLGVRGAY